MDRRFSSGIYARSGLYAGQGLGQGLGLGNRRESTFGNGLGGSGNGSFRYNSRKTLGPSQLGVPYIPSLKRCVASMEASTRLLKSTVERLDEVTTGYPRLKTITSHTKKYELVSEQDIASAQVEVAREVEPQLFSLTEKAVDMITYLEEEEQTLIDQVQAETNIQKERLQRQKAARSGLSNIKRLQSLTRRKDELSRSASELDEVLDQKKQEFRLLLEKANVDESRSNQAGSSKRARRSMSHESRELHQRLEERKKELAKRKQEFSAMQLKLQEKKESVRRLRSKSDVLNNSTASDQDNFNPTIPWGMYSDHQAFFEGAMKTGLALDARDSSVYEETFARIIAPYLRELDSRQGKTDKQLNRLTRDKSKKLSQIRNLCKQLFPEENIGQTMVRVLELLVESTDSELYYKDLVQNEFPTEEERRHNLSRVIGILKQVGVIEVVLETQEGQDNEDEQEGESGLTEEQLIIRIKFEDNAMV
ncbi:Spc19-domain-containing protein [Mortierella sp. GBAus27b]|nr:hypothetical protein BGX31_008370 [Mortierella sp. GBA43]KAI8347110.1 Spc19-domain-containing protein [Mortierella sp. GBAus27b]